MQNTGQEVNEKEPNDRPIEIDNFVNVNFYQSDQQTQTDKYCCINNLWNGNLALFSLFQAEY